MRAEPQKTGEKNPTAQRVLRHALPALALAYITLISLLPLADPDLFWHLRAGQDILQNRELPGSEDLYSYTASNPLPPAQVAGLRSQWMGQVALYLSYHAGGYWGLAVFRTFMLLLPFAALYVLADREGVGGHLSVPILALPALLIILSMHYVFERPQAFTFVLCFGLVLLLRALYDSKRRVALAAALAALMALWSNLHGGFIFGLALLLAFSAGIVLEALLYRSRERLPALLCTFAGAAATGLNPNAYGLSLGVLGEHMGRVLGLSGPAQSGTNAAIGPTGPAGAAGAGYDSIARIMEYKPLWYFYSEYHYIWPLFMMALMALALAAVVAKYAWERRVNFPEAAMVSVVLAFGLYYARGATLALVIMPLFALTSIKALPRLPRALTAIAALALVVALLGITASRSPWQLRPSVPANMGIDRAYPEGAVAFLLSNEVPGPMFNSLIWGGYVTWMTGAQYKVFTDGRLIGPEVLAKYSTVYRALPGGAEVLDEYGVNFLLVPVFSLEGGVVEPLVMSFLRSGAGPWRLVYSGANSAVFLRDTERNARLIRYRGLPLEVLNLTVLNGSERLLRIIPGHPRALLSMAFALYGLGRFDEAERILQVLGPSVLRDELVGKIRSRKRF